ncbi:retrovirus-related pol polyprotein from transposon TNT 1-94 [Tanacetum coccineum]
MVTPAPQDRWSQDKHIELINIIGDLVAGMLTRSMVKELSAASAHECLSLDFLSEEEPKKVFEALQHPGWFDAMQDELKQFDRNKVLTLVIAPYGKTIIGLKWVFRNKRDETRIVIKNKAQLVAQGYNQQEGIDYNETFAPIARLEAIRIFLAFATYMNFTVYQMYFKSAFINGKLKEDVYVKQPTCFESSEFPNHVCKLDKALYGLKQAPRACRPDIQFSTCLCARYQANPKESHLIAVKRIFRYLKGTPSLGSKGKAPQVLVIARSLNWVPGVAKKQQSCGIRGDIGINTFRNALRAHYLPNSSMYVPSPFITTVRPWFATVGYSGEIGAKGTLKKSFFPIMRRLLMSQIIQCLGGKTGVLDQISNKDAIILYCLDNGVKTPKLQNLPYKLRRFHKAKRLELKLDSEENNLQNTHLSPRLRHPNLKLANLEKETTSNLAKDKSPSHPLPPTLVVGEMHKEAQQVVGGLTSLGATSKEGSHPQLSSGCDASTDSKAEADPGTSALNDFIPLQQDQTKSVRDGLKTAHTDSGINKESRANDISKKIKMEDLLDLLKDTRSAFFTPDSPQDEHIIVSNESEEEETEKDEDTHATSHDIPKDTLSQKEKLEQQKAKAKEEVASLKVWPPYPDINQLTELLISFLKPKLSKLLALHDFSNCLPTELKEFPSKFTKLSRNIKELKKHKKLQTLDSLPSILNKVTETLNRFSTVVEHTSGATTKDVCSAGQATASPAEGEKNTNPTSKVVEPNMYDELVDLLGIDIVTQYYNNKLLYDKYNDKMLKRRKSFKITNYNVLIQKGPISLNVYREDGTIEVISNFKVGDLYLAKWRELKIDFNKPLKEQDPLKELNDLANKKRKRTDDLTDHSRSTKKYKSLVQHEEEVLRRLGSIFTSVYAAVQKLKKKLKRVVSLLEGNQSVSKASALSDNSQQQNTHPTLNIQPTIEPTTINVNAEENNTDQAVDAQYAQEESIYFEELFAPVPRLEAVWIFIAYATHKSFPIYQTDVKVAFLYGPLKEEQAVRDWYDKLSTFLMSKGFPKDANHVGCLDTRKSTSGGIQFLCEKLFSWMSKKLDCTAMSTTEVKYVALSASCAQEQVEHGIIELYFIRTEYQLADMFTKAPSQDRFEYLVRRLGMRCLTPAELEVLAKETA